MAALKVDIDTLKNKLDQIQAMNVAADEAYVSSLTRAELNRVASIRREPKRDGSMLVKADAGTLLAIKNSQGKWRLVVYRDPLTDQLTDG